MASLRFKDKSICPCFVLTCCLLHFISPSILLEKPVRITLHLCTPCSSLCRSVSHPCFLFQKKKGCCLLIPGVTQGALIIPHTLLCHPSSSLQICLAVFWCKKPFPNSCKLWYLHLRAWCCSTRRGGVSRVRLQLCSQEGHR